MKITKRRTNITIRCSAGEFAMLDKLVNATPRDAARRMLSGDARSAHTRRLNATGGDLLKIDQDASLNPRTGRVNFGTRSETPTLLED